MENTEMPAPAEEPVSQLIVTENMRSYIYDMAKWANFLAIVGFVISGFLILASFTLGSAMQTNPELGEKILAMGLTPMAFTIFLLLYAFAVFYPSLLLFKYSVKARLGVLFADQASLEDSLSKMKALFKYLGIMVLIFISVYLLAFIISVLQLA